MHGKTREPLFSAVFDRDVRCAIGELWHARLQDPRSRLLHRFARTYFPAIVRQQLLNGVRLDDPDVLGKLTASYDASVGDGHTSARDTRHEVGSPFP